MQVVKVIAADVQKLEVEGFQIVHCCPEGRSRLVAVVYAEASQLGERVNFGENVAAVYAVAADVEPLQVGELVQVADEGAS